MSEVARHLTIHGRVQGVGYRAWADGEATARGLCGWVRNRREGTVEAVFCGPEQLVEEMVQLCWQGPPMAQVREIDQEPCAPPEDDGFEQLPTL
ncbi:MAG: acylphosphatase [Pseudomonadota bacterium]